MRRSIRDAIVGLSILGGIVGLAGFTLWLRGINIASGKWSITASFSDASGLAERSPVTYRGILVGSVGKIEITPSNVQAKIEINKKDLRLVKPVFAKVITSSLLGGDAQVALVSNEDQLPQKAPFPKDKNCIPSKILCQGEFIQGQPLMSISTLTEQLEKLIQNADNQNIVSNLVDSTKQFDETQKNLDELILQAKEEIDRAEPIITNLIDASNNFNDILSAINNPETLKDFQETASSTRSLTKKMDNIGGDLKKIMADSELMEAIRTLTIGLSELFNELYPSN